VPVCVHDQTELGHMIDGGILDDLGCWCLDKSSYERFSFIVDVLVVLPLSVVGIAGNTLSVIVLNHDTSVNYATTLLLSAIAIVDNVYLLSCLLYQTGKALCYGTHLMFGLRPVYPQVWIRTRLCTEMLCTLSLRLRPHAPVRACGRNRNRNLEGLYHDGHSNENVKN